MKRGLSNSDWARNALGVRYKMPTANLWPPGCRPWLHDRKNIISEYIIDENRPSRLCIWTCFAMNSFVFAPAEGGPISRLPKNAVPGSFFFLTYQAYQNLNALFNLRSLLVVILIARNLTKILERLKLNQGRSFDSDKCFTIYKLLVCSS